ncbi:MAG: histidine phosphatase family protein [Acidimicrobiia bacterium]|nr:histidine phosphatase family protein [Acidimicrobiia bacterium]
MPRLFFVRHAPTPETGSILTGRTPGVGLAQAGKTSAQYAAAQFASGRFAALYTSPVQRCRETAAELASVIDLKPRVMKAFEEVDYGDWAGRKLKDLNRLKAWRHLYTAPSRVRFPNGESLAEAQSRAIVGCETIASVHKRGEHVIVVTHADVIKSVVSHYLGAPQDLFQRISVTPTSITVLDLPRNGHPTIQAVNVRSDIEGWLK